MDLHDYYKTNFLLMHKFNWSLSELDDMMPFEREIYVGILSKWLADEAERKKNQA